MTLLAVEALAVEVAGARAVDGATFTLARGEVLGLLAGRGAGASLIGAAIAGRLPRAASLVGGRVVLDAVRLDTLLADEWGEWHGRRIGAVWQDSDGLLDPLITVGGQLAETLRTHRPQLSRGMLRDRVRDWLEAVGVPARHAGDYPHELSAALLHRVALALALCPGPELLVADDPTAGLDPPQRPPLAAQLRRLARGQGTAVLLISHDAAVLAAACDRVAVMRQGRLSPAGPAAPVLASLDPPALPPSPPARNPARVAAVAEPAMLLLDEIVHRFGATEVIGGVSLAIPRGAALALLGERGSGKTVLARIAAGLLAPSGGEVRVGGARVRAGRLPAMLRQRITMLPDDPVAALEPRWTLRDTIAEPIRVFRLRPGANAIATRVAELLAMVGLDPDLAGRYPAELTPEQGVRAALARALAGDPTLLVCDTPADMLEDDARAAVLLLLRDLQARLGLTLFITGTDPAVARGLADLVAVIQRGQLLEFGTAAAVLAGPRHPYTRRLLAASPDLPVSPSGMAVAGCTFQAHCSLATDRCGVQVPRLQFAAGIAVACHAVEEGRG